LGSRCRGRCSRTVSAHRAGYLRLLVQLLLAGTGSRPPQQLSQLDQQMCQRHKRLAQPGPGVSMSFMRLSTVLLLLNLFSATAQAGVLFVSAYPDRVLVIDEATQQVVDTIQPQVGLPTGVRLSYDRKKIFITTGDNNGVAVIDLATHKVLNHFTLNTSKTQYRFNSVAPVPKINSSTRFERR